MTDLIICGLYLSVPERTISVVGVLFQDLHKHGTAIRQAAIAAVSWACDAELVDWLDLDEVAIFCWFRLVYRLVIPYIYVTISAFE